MLLSASSRLSSGGSVGVSTAPRPSPVGTGAALACRLFRAAAARLSGVWTFISSARPITTASAPYTTVSVFRALCTNAPSAHMASTETAAAARKNQRSGLLGISSESRNSAGSTAENTMESARKRFAPGLGACGAAAWAASGGLSSRCERRRFFIL